MNRLEELKLHFKNESLGKFLGATLDNLNDGFATVSVRIKDEFLIVAGFVQGGITTTIADFAGVYAAMSKLPAGHTPASNINIYFLRPISKQDELMRAEAYVVNESKSSLLVRVDVYGSDKKLKACATILFAKPKA